MQGHIWSNKRNIWKDAEDIWNRKQGVAQTRLSLLGKLVIILGCYHDYRAMKNIAFNYDVSKSRICDAISWVEMTLIKDGTFALPSRWEMLRPNSKISVSIIDVT